MKEEEREGTRDQCAENELKEYPKRKVMLQLPHNTPKGEYQEILGSLIRVPAGGGRREKESGGKGCKNQEENFNGMKQG